MGFGKKKAKADKSGSHGVDQSNPRSNFTPKETPSEYVATSNSPRERFANKAAVVSDNPGNTSRDTAPMQVGIPTQKAQSHKKRAIIIVLIAIIVAIAIWACLWIFACSGPSIFDSNAQTGQAPYKTDEEIQAELDRVVEEGMFNISIASAIQFENGTSAGTAYIENVPGNNYLMQVTITDDDTGDVLYESGVLKPNQYIEKITLVKDLDAGMYDATATFTAIEEDTLEEVGNAAAKVTINVAN